MGGGLGKINFGNTVGSRLDAESNEILAKSSIDFLDALSAGLSAASLIPGLDTITNLLSIPVDLARGDYVSAGLSAVGVIPVIGEVADTAKIVKMADKAVDTAKATNKVSKVTSVADNAKNVAKKYNLGKSGYFGTKGKNTQVFKSADPIKSSADFYNKISKGGRKSALSNGKGVQAVFEDGSRVVYRVITKTPNSPAVSITVTNPGRIKPQKIHFIK